MYTDYFHISPGRGAARDLSAFGAAQTKLRAEYGALLWDEIVRWPAGRCVGRTGCGIKALQLQGCHRCGLWGGLHYNELLIGYEYVRDCATLVHERGMVNVLVTSGAIEETPWRELLPLIDAANIDLKGFAPEWYRRLGGDLKTVKRSISLAAEWCHAEVTMLLIPGEDDSEEVGSLARWLVSVDREIPLHLSRFFRRYRMMARPPTAVGWVYRLVDVAWDYLSLSIRGIADIDDN